MRCEIFHRACRKTSSGPAADQIRRRDAPSDAPSAANWQKGEAESLAQETALAVPRPLVEDRAESLLVKAHPESELVRKLCDHSLAVFLLRRPEPLQFFLVNGAVFPFADLQLAFDVGSKRFRANADLAQVAIGLSRLL